MQIFVSYNRADNTWAEWIAWEFEANGHEVILQAWDFSPGSNFVLEMDRATKTADRVIVVLSPDYLKSQYTPSEWASGFAVDPLGLERRLLPVRVRPFDLTGLLKQIVYVDLVGVDENTARDRLLAAASGKRGKPKEPPSFPGSSLGLASPEFPGSSNFTSHIPIHRNPYFHGREDFLELLRQDVVRVGNTPVTHVLWGMGGVGKSQIALEYAHRYGADYATVFWVRAGDTTILLEDLQRILVSLNPQGAIPSNPTALLDSAQNLLSQNRDWLLVVDDARSYGEIARLLPRSAKGHVIITSRSPNWDVVTKPIHVPVFNRCEAVAFLARRTNLLQEQDARSLAEELGDLPLALDQAAAYVVMTGKSLFDYLQLYRKHREVLIQAPNPGIDRDEHHGISATWDISIEGLRSEAPAALSLLTMCSFLGADDIPRDLFSKAARVLPEPLQPSFVNPLEYDRVVATLRRYSLIQLGPTSISVHRMIQASVRGRLDVAQRHSTLEMTLPVVLNYLGDVQSSMMEFVGSPIVGHIAVLAEHLVETAVETPESVTLQFFAGFSLAGRGQFLQAKRFLELASSIGERVLSPLHPVVLGAKGYLAMVLQVLEENDKAKEVGSALSSQLIEPSDTESVAVAETMSKALELVRNPTPNSAQFREIILSMANVFANSPPDSAALIDALNMLTDPTSHTDAWEELIRTVDTDTVSEPGKSSDPILPLKLIGLAKVWLVAGLPLRAKKAAEKAIKAFEVSWGGSHPMMSQAIALRAHALEDLNEIEAARTDFDRAQQLAAEGFGALHSDVLVYRSHLMSLAAQCNAKEQANEIYKELVGIIGRITDLNPQGSIQANFGIFHYCQGRLEDAEKAFLLALELHSHAMDPVPYFQAKDAYYLAKVQSDQGRLSEAKSGFERCLELLRGHHGYSLLIRGMIGLSEVHRRTRSRRTARQWLLKACEASEQVMGHEHPLTIELRGRLQAASRIAEKSSERQVP